MTRRIKYLVALSSAILIVAALGAAVAWADVISVVVTGDNLSVTTSGNQSLTGVTLNGLDQTTGGNLGQYEAVDPRGTGAGWNVVVTATDFVKQGDPTKTISATGFDATGGDPVTTVAGNNPPSSLGGGLDGGGAKILSAAVGEGMGTYQVTPAVTLLVPAETYAGTYDSTVTATIQTGP